MGPLSRTGFTVFLVLLSIVMVAVQVWFGEVPAWMLCSNWAISGIAAYMLWDCVSRYGLGRIMIRGSFVVPWVIMASMANVCCTCFSIRLMAAENYVAIACFLVVIRVSMALWQNVDAARILVWQGVLIGAASSVYPGVLLWIMLVPLQIFFMRCGGLKNFLVTASGMLLGIWVAYCILFFWGSEESLQLMSQRYYDLLVVDQDLHISTIWQKLVVYIVAGMTILYCLITFTLGGSNSLRSQSINHLLCICQIMVLLFTLLDMNHMPVYLLLQTMMLGLQLIVILANSRGYLSEWWTMLIMLCYMGLSVGPYLPKPLLHQAWNLMFENI